MCLLDEVVHWDAAAISCRSGTHRAVDNPLRARGQLGIACGIEYAAQAMAVHGALTGGALTGAGARERPAHGYLAGVRGVEFRVLRLDDLPDDLFCDAVRAAGNDATALYEFELRCAQQTLLTGRATVVLTPRERFR
jgi:predicted hotdog family 3-hydroxylacyl-ACP dehydratase